MRALIRGFEIEDRCGVRQRSRTKVRRVLIFRLPPRVLVRGSAAHM
jgi:hypothetical protein